MIVYLERRRFSWPVRVLSLFISFSFILTSVFPTPAVAQAVTAGFFNLPQPGMMLTPSPGYIPPMIRGLIVHPENPLQFDFIVNSGDELLTEEEVRAESDKLVKYFLAALTVPEEEVWVNLSPYEGERMIPESFGQTEMGRDLLAQDYLLKQLTASMMYPEDELGQKFWDRVYKKAQDKFGTIDIPINTFNKVWIVPQEAVVYQNGPTVYVVSSYLKVMLESDYFALERSVSNENRKSKIEGRKNRADNLSSIGYSLSSDQKEVNDLSSQIIKEVIIPEIEKEINQGKTFANLRQMYNSMILATWYKLNLKQSLLGQVYADQSKTKGVDQEDKTANQKIYDQYLEAFRVGVYDFIKEDYDPSSNEMIPRKYFSGGYGSNTLLRESLRTIQGAPGELSTEQAAVVRSGFSALRGKDFLSAVNLYEIGADAEADELVKVRQGLPQVASAQGELSPETTPARFSTGEALLTQPIEQLKFEKSRGLPDALWTRLFDALRAAEITTIGQLVEMTEKEVRGIPGIGPKFLNTLGEALSHKQLSFDWGGSGESNLSSEGMGLKHFPDVLPVLDLNDFGERVEALVRQIDLTRDISPKDQEAFDRLMASINFDDSDFQQMFALSDELEAKLQQRGSLIAPLKFFGPNNEVGLLLVAYARGGVTPAHKHDGKFYRYENFRLIDGEVLVESFDEVGAMAESVEDGNFVRFVRLQRKSSDFLNKHSVYSEPKSATDIHQPKNYGANPSRLLLLFVQDPRVSGMEKEVRKGALANTNYFSIHKQKDLEAASLFIPTDGSVWTKRVVPGAVGELSSEIDKQVKDIVGRKLSGEEISGLIAVASKPADFKARLSQMDISLGKKARESLRQLVKDQQPKRGPKPPNPMKVLKARLAEGERPSEVEIYTALRDGIDFGEIEAEMKRSGNFFSDDDLAEWEALKSERGLEHLSLLQLRMGFGLTDEQVSSIFDAMELEQDDAILDVYPSLSILSMIAALRGAKVMLVEPRPRAAEALALLGAQLKGPIVDAGGFLAVMNGDVSDPKLLEFIKDWNKRDKQDPKFKHVWAQTVSDQPDDIVKFILQFKKPQEGTVYVTDGSFSLPTENVVSRGLRGQGFDFELHARVSTAFQPAALVGTGGSLEEGVIYRFPGPVEAVGDAEQGKAAPVKQTGGNFIDEALKESSALTPEPLILLESSGPSQPIERLILRYAGLHEWIQNSLQTMAGRLSDVPTDEVTKKVFFGQVMEPLQRLFAAVSKEHRQLDLLLDEAVLMAQQRLNEEDAKRLYVQAIQWSNLVSVDIYQLSLMAQRLYGISAAFGLDAREEFRETLKPLGPKGDVPTSIQVKEVADSGINAPDSAAMGGYLRGIQEGIDYLISEYARIEQGSPSIGNTLGALYQRISDELVTLRRYIGGEVVYEDDQEQDPFPLNWALRDTLWRAETLIRLEGNNYFTIGSAEGLTGGLVERPEMREKFDKWTEQRDRKHAEILDFVKDAYRLLNIDLDGDGETGGELSSEVILSERPQQNKTKSVVTLGPASDSDEMIEDLIEAGTDVFRINYSHVNEKDEQARALDLIKRIRAISGRLKRPVGILQDLAGPKIRTSKLDKGINVKRKDSLTFYPAQRSYPAVKGIAIPIEYDGDILAEINSGEVIALNDGNVRMTITKVERDGGYFEAEAFVGGKIEAKKNGVNLPMSNLSVRSLTDKDRRDFIDGFEAEVDFVALSFVRTASDVQDLINLIMEHKLRYVSDLKAALNDSGILDLDQKLRDRIGQRIPRDDVEEIYEKIDELNLPDNSKRELILKFRRLGTYVPIIPKIEHPEAVKNIDEILELSDAIMVARGDYVAETDISKLAPMQKQVIRKAREAGVPVIVATQNLGGMEEGRAPSRGEAVAIYDQVVNDEVDAQMLSGETAKTDPDDPQKPLRALKTLESITREAEAEAERQRRKGPHVSDSQTHLDVVASSAVTMSNESDDVKALVVFTGTGNAPRLIAKRRPFKPIIAITRRERVARMLNIVRGVNPVAVQYMPQDRGEFHDYAVAVTRHVMGEQIKEAEKAGEKFSVVMHHGDPERSSTSNTVTLVDIIRETNGDQGQWVRLSREQRRRLEASAQKFGLPETDKEYLRALMRQRLTLKKGQGGATRLKIANMDGRSDEELLANGENFILAADAGGEQQTDGGVKGTVQYEELETDPDNARVAKEKAITTLNSMDGGIGESLARLLFLQEKARAAGATEGEVNAIVMGAKGTDLGYFITIGDEKRFASVAEVKVLQVLELAQSGAFAGMKLQPLVNWQSKTSYENLLSQPTFVDNSISYRQALEAAGVEILPMLEQVDLPWVRKDAEMPTLIDQAENDKGVVVRFRQPGGHGQFGFRFLWETAFEKPRTDGKVDIRIFYNGDNLNSRANPHITGHMVRNGLPIIKLTTDATRIDKKGGKDGFKLVKVGDRVIRVPGQMEIADAKAVGQEKEFYAAGQGEGERQPLNTNIFYINTTVLSGILGELKAIIGEERLAEIVSPLYIEKAAKKDADGNEYIPMDGAIGTAMHNLNEFFMTTDDPEVLQILSRRGLDRVLFFVNVPRALAFTPIKNPYDIYMQNNTDAYNGPKKDTGWALAEAVEGLSPPEISLEDDDDYWKEYQHLVNSFGTNQGIRGLDSLEVKGRGRLPNAVLKGKVKINFFSDVDIFENDHEFPKAPDGRPILDNVEVIVTPGGAVTVVPLDGVPLDSVWRDRPVSSIMRGSESSQSKTRATTILEENGIDTVGKLANMTEAEVKALHGVGETIFDLISSKLHGVGLSFREPSSELSSEADLKWDIDLLSTNDYNIRDEAAYRIDGNGDIRALMFGIWGVLSANRWLNSQVGDRTYRLGIAVEPEQFEAIKAAFGATEMPQSTGLAGGTRVFELTSKAWYEIDVMTYRAPEGEIYTFLQNAHKRKGVQKYLHHIKLYTPDIERGIKEIKKQQDSGDKRIRVLTEAPVPGASHQDMVGMFLFTLDNGQKVMLELVQKGARSGELSPEADEPSGFIVTDEMGSLDDLEQNIRDHLASLPDTRHQDILFPVVLKAVETLRSNLNPYKVVDAGNGSFKVEIQYDVLYSFALLSFLYNGPDGSYKVHPFLEGMVKGSELSVSIFVDSNLETFLHKALIQGWVEAQFQPYLNENNLTPGASRSIAYIFSDYAVTGEGFRFLPVQAQRLGARHMGEYWSLRSRRSHIPQEARVKFWTDLKAIAPQRWGGVNPEVLYEKTGNTESEIEDLLDRAERRFRETVSALRGNIVEDPTSHEALHNQARLQMRQTLGRKLFKRVGLDDVTLAVKYLGDRKYGGFDVVYDPDLVDTDIVLSYGLPGKHSGIVVTPKNKDADPDIGELSGETVTVEKADDGVANIVYRSDSTNERERKQNVLTLKAIRAMSDSVDKVEADGNVKTVVFDIQSEAGLASGASPEEHLPGAKESEVVQATTELLIKLANMKKPKGAIVRAGPDGKGGYAVGASLELLLGMDYVVAINNDKTRFGFPEIKLGAMAPYAAALLPRLVAYKYREYTRDPDMIPAFSSNIRQQRLFETADWLLAGNVYDWNKAMPMGIIDAVQTTEERAAGLLKVKLEERAKKGLPSRLKEAFEHQPTDQEIRPVDWHALALINENNRAATDGSPSEKGIARFNRPQDESKPFYRLPEVVLEAMRYATINFGLRSETLEDALNGVEKFFLTTAMRDNDIDRYTDLARAVKKAQGLTPSKYAEYGLRYYLANQTFPTDWSFDTVRGPDLEAERAEIVRKVLVAMYERGEFLAGQNFENQAIFRPGGFPVELLLELEAGDTRVPPMSIISQNRVFKGIRIGRDDALLVLKVVREVASRISGNSVAAVSKAYTRGETDEFVEPTMLVDGEGNPIGRLRNGDYVSIVNFRPDRARQITRVLTGEQIDEGDFDNQGLDLDVTTMTEYQKGLVPEDHVVMPTIVYDQSSGEVVSDAGFTQVRIAETEKYAHVTYFINGGSREEPLTNEDRVLVPSPKVETYDQTPEMRTVEVTDEIIKAIDAGYNSIKANYAAGDMVGHTGDFDAAVKAVEIVDDNLGRLVPYAVENGYTIVITSDHGNVEKMRDEDGKPHTAHSTNLVPFIVIPSKDVKGEGEVKSGGTLIDVAPTVLDILGLEKSEKMTGQSLVEGFDFSAAPKKVIEIILDGWGINENREDPYDATRVANTPNMDKYLASKMDGKIVAHGGAVGLPEGIMGNSEVGHMAIGLGRVPHQSLSRINMAIEDGSFFNQGALVEAMKRAKTEQDAKGEDAPGFHILGLVSDGGVHSDMGHIYAQLELAKRMGLSNVYVHAILDGRDTPQKSADKYLADLEAKTQEIGVGTVVDIIGRFNAMDRDKRWERTKKAFDLYAKGDAAHVFTGELSGEGVAKADFSHEFLTRPITFSVEEVSRDEEKVVFKVTADTEFITRQSMAVRPSLANPTPENTAQLIVETLEDALKQRKLVGAWNVMGAVWGTLDQLAHLKEVRMVERRFIKPDGDNEWPIIIRVTNLSEDSENVWFRMWVDSPNLMTTFLLSRPRGEHPTPAVVSQSVVDEIRRVFQGRGKPADNINALITILNRVNAVVLDPIGLHFQSVADLPVTTFNLSYFVTEGLARETSDFLEEQDIKVIRQLIEKSKDEILALGASEDVFVVLRDALHRFHLRFFEPKSGRKGSGELSTENLPIEVSKDDALRLVTAYRDLEKGDMGKEFVDQEGGVSGTYLKVDPIALRVWQIDRQEYDVHPNKFKDGHKVDDGDKSASSELSGESPVTIPASLGREVRPGRFVLEDRIVEIINFVVFRLTEISEEIQKSNLPSVSEDQAAWYETVKRVYERFPEEEYLSPFAVERPFNQFQLAFIQLMAFQEGITDIGQLQDALTSGNIFVPRSVAEKMDAKALESWAHEEHHIIFDQARKDNPDQVHQLQELYSQILVHAQGIELSDQDKQIFAGEAPEGSLKTLADLIVFGMSGYEGLKDQAEEFWVHALDQREIHELLDGDAEDEKIVSVDTIPLVIRLTFMRLVEEDIFVQEIEDALELVRAQRRKAQAEADKDMRAVAETRPDDKSASSELASESRRGDLTPDDIRHRLEYLTAELERINGLLGGDVSPAELAWVSKELALKKFELQAEIEALKARLPKEGEFLAEKRQGDSTPDGIRRQIKYLTGELDRIDKLLRDASSGELAEMSQKLVIEKSRIKVEIAALEAKLPPDSSELSSEQELLEQSVIELNIAPDDPIMRRTIYQILDDHSIVTIGDLVDTSEDELLELPRLGDLALLLIKKALYRKGQSLRDEFPTADRGRIKSQPVRVLSEMSRHSTRAWTIATSKLKEAGVHTIGDVLAMTEEQVAAIIDPKTKPFEALKDGLHLHELKLKRSKKKNRHEMTKKEILALPVSELRFSREDEHMAATIITFLERAGIMTIGDLVKKTKTSFFTVEGIGEGSVNAIERALAEDKLSFREPPFGGLHWPNSDLLKYPVSELKRAGFTSLDEWDAIISALEAHRVRTIGGLSRRSKANIAAIPGIGAQRATMIERALSFRGIPLRDGYGEFSSETTEIETTGANSIKGIKVNQRAVITREGGEAWEQLEILFDYDLDGTRLYRITGERIAVMRDGSPSLLQGDKTVQLNTGPKGTKLTFYLSDNNIVYNDDFEGGDRIVLRILDNDVIQIENSNGRKKLIVESDAKLEIQSSDVAARDVEEDEVDDVLASEVIPGVSLENFLLQMDQRAGESSEYQEAVATIRAILRWSKDQDVETHEAIKSEMRAFAQKVQGKKQTATADYNASLALIDEIMRLRPGLAELTPTQRNNLLTLALAAYEPGENTTMNMRIELSFMMLATVAGIDRRNLVNEIAAYSLSFLGLDLSMQRDGLLDQLDEIARQDAEEQAKLDADQDAEADGELSGESREELFARPVRDIEYLRPASEYSDRAFWTRIFNSFDQADITTIGQLVIMTEDEVLKLDNIGRGSLVLIKEALKQKKFRLGMVGGELSGEASDRFRPERPTVAELRNRIENEGGRLVDYVDELLSADSSESTAIEVLNLVNEDNFTEFQIGLLLRSLKKLLYRDNPRVVQATLEKLDELGQLDAVYSDLRELAKFKNPNHIPETITEWDADSTGEPIYAWTNEREVKVPNPEYSRLVESEKERREPHLRVIREIEEYRQSRGTDSDSALSSETVLETSGPAAVAEIEVGRSSAVLTREGGEKWERIEITFRTLADSKIPLYDVHGENLAALREGFVSPLTGNKKIMIDWAGQEMGFTFYPSQQNIVINDPWEQGDTVVIAQLPNGKLKVDNSRASKKLIIQLAEKADGALSSETVSSLAGMMVLSLGDTLMSDLSAEQPNREFSGAELRLLGLISVLSAAGTGLLVSQQTDDLVSTGLVAAGVGVAAAVGVWIFKWRFAAHPYLKEMRSSDAKVRRSAMEQLSRLGSKRQIEKLLPYLGDLDKSVRRETAKTLRALGATTSQLREGYIAVLEGNESSAVYLVRAKKLLDDSKVDLSNFDFTNSKVLEALEAQMKEFPMGDIQAMKDAVLALQGLGGKRAKQALLNSLLHSKEYDPGFRGSIFDALQKLGVKKEEIISFAGNLLFQGKDFDLRPAALTLAENDQADRAVNTLVKRLNDSRDLSTKSHIYKALKLVTRAGSGKSSEFEMVSKAIRDFESRLSEVPSPGDLKYKLFPNALSVRERGEDFEIRYTPPEYDYEEYTVVDEYYDPPPSDQFLGGKFERTEYRKIEKAPEKWQVFAKGKAPGTKKSGPGSELSSEADGKSERERKAILDRIKVLESELEQETTPSWRHHVHPDATLEWYGDRQVWMMPDGSSGEEYENIKDYTKRGKEIIKELDKLRSQLTGLPESNSDLSSEKEDSDKPVKIISSGTTALDASSDYGSQRYWETDDTIYYETVDPGYDAHGKRVVIGRPSGIDDGELSSEADAPLRKGGIDFNPELLDLQIKRGPDGVPLPLPQQPIHQMNIDGFLPVIINVTPIPSVPLLLGFADTPGTDREISASELMPAEPRARLKPETQATVPERLSMLN